MKILMTAAVFVFLGVLFPPAPASAQAVGTVSSNISSGSAITPMNISPQNMTRPNIPGHNVTRPNISRAPARQSGNVPSEHFLDSIVSKQQVQQKNWEAQMRERQKQEQARLDAEAAAAAEAAKAAARIAPAAGDSASEPAQKKPSIFSIGFIKLVSLFAPARHDSTAADNP